ncbi:pentapeptide repeat-containing protein [Patescibacteria group bacterium]|nr:pentapeptide repeat-containing protein [Patescibacteria group bacterium]
MQTLNEDDLLNLLKTTNKISGVFLIKEASSLMDLDFIDTVFENCEIYGGDFCSGIFKNCTFNNVLFRKSAFIAVDFSNCNFIECVFSNIQADYGLDNCIVTRLDTANESDEAASYYRFGLKANL